MKMNGKSKKIIIGLIGFCMALVIFGAEVMTNITDVQAETMVFGKIKDTYGQADQTFTILEIEPTDATYEYTARNSGTYTVSKQAELGYFLATKKKGPYDGDRIDDGFGKSSRGGIHGDPNTNWTNNSVDEYGKFLMGLRSYGMIKPEGQDTQGTANSIGEYPLYSMSGAVFTPYKTDLCSNAYAESFERGVYTLTDQADGEYNIADGYTINANGQICKYEEMSVSKNEVPEGSVYVDPADPDSVSDNSVVVVKVPKPANVNESIVGLPVDIDGTAIITQSPTLGSDQKTRTGGNVKFARSWDTTEKTEYWGYSDRVLYFATSGTGTVGFVNSDWFKEYVFGSNNTYKDKEIDYQCKKASQVSKADIAGADLIYINGTNSSFIASNSDLSTEVINDLYNKVVVEHKALMMDYAAYSADLNNNISKLALLLWQNDQTSLTNTAKDKGCYDETTKTFKDLDKFVADQTVAESLKKTIMSGANGNFVVGNTYVYNHHMSDFDSPKSLVDAYDNFANGDFNSAYKSSVASEGFGEVLSYISATNKNSLSGTMPLSVTPAVAIQYILVSDGRGLAIVKNNLRILEIQPTTTFRFNEKSGSEEYVDLASNSQKKANRDAFITNYLSSYYNDEQLKKFIEFESMTIDEFNGRNEDLIENYDIIYIGSELGNLYYTDGGTASDGVSTYTAVNGIYGSANAAKMKLPLYTDPAMTGMVYYNIGDLVNTNAWLVGYLDTDPDDIKSLNVTNDTESDRDANIVGKSYTGTTRYPGRDLTRTKLKKLEAYVDAQCLMIVEGDLMGPSVTADNVVINPTAVVNESTKDADKAKDHGRVDNASNIYELLQYTRGYRYNKETGQYENKKSGTVTTTQTSTVADALTDTVAAQKNDGDYTNYIGKNVVTTSQFAAGTVTKDSISQYVATEKLSLSVTKKPQEYTYQRKDNTQVINPESVQYLEQNADGSRTLTYEFTIESTDTDGSVIATYKPHLYIDINNDGKYSGTTEDITDITVEDSNGTEAAKNEKGEYVLQKNIKYTLKREISKDYCGLLKWKLDVESYQYANSHASEEGYTLAENISGEEKVCSILQITSYKTKHSKYGYSNGSTLNLQAELKNPSSKYGQYLNNVPGYKIVVTTVDIATFENDFQKAWDEYKQQADPNNNLKDLNGFALDYFAAYHVGEEKDDTGKVTVKGEVGANMLVLGFGDDYANFTKSDAMQAVEAFVESGKPVLLAHDFIMFNAGYQQVKELRNLVGMDCYGVSQNIITDGDTLFKSLANSISAPKGSKDYLHTGKDYTRANDAAEVKLIESTGKRVAYQPGMARKTLLRYTQGFTNTLTAWQRSGNNKLWINSNLVSMQGNGEANYTVEKLNDGQLTVYPYTLPDQFTVASTHSQYFQLDMDADDDNDGESDVVVWYTLGDSGNDFNPYASNAGGLMPANGYYIYNKGNITYTGAGHSATFSTTSSDAEAQLFVNTLMGSFTAKYTAPSIGFFEKPDMNASPITSLAIPYDKNVTKPVDPENPDANKDVVDSSVLTKEDGTRKYQFVDPNTQAGTESVGTPIFFRLNDTNFVRGNKYITIKYYLKTDGYDEGDEYTLNNGVKAHVETVNGVSVVDISKYINTYNVANGVFTTTLNKDGATGKVSGLSSMTTYGFYLPLSYLNENGAFKIMMEAQTTVNTVSSTTGNVTSSTDIQQKAYKELTVTKTDLLDLD